MAARKLNIAKIKYQTALQDLDMIHGLSLKTLDESELNEFKLRYLNIEKIYKHLSDAHLEIQLHSDEDFDIAEHRLGYEKWNKLYYVVKCKYLNLFPESKLEESFRSTTSRDEHNKPRNVFLPRIQIPTFTGKIEEFVSFMDLFESLIGDDTSLSMTEKLYYLISSLGGEAKTLVQHLSITGDNYSIALELLQKRYKNKRFLADKLLNNFLRFTHITKNLNSMKCFLNALLENTKALEKMDFPVPEWSYLLFYINFQKLDSGLKTQFEERHVGKELPNFNDLINFLENEVRILEASSDVRVNKQITAPSRSHASFEQDVTASPMCKFCKEGSHHISKCDAFLSLKAPARKQFVIDCRLCFRCLGAHNIYNCRSNGYCFQCKSDKHHHLLHFDKVFTTSTSPRVDVPVADPQAEAVHVAVPGNSNAALTSHIVLPTTYQRSVLLSTAMVMVKDGCGIYQTVRALLDPGSQSTFIAEACAQRLNLRRYNSKIVTVTGLSGAHVSGCRGGVTLSISPCQANKPVLVTSATILSRITYNLPNFTLPASIADNFKDIVLADSKFYLSREVELLIGADLIGDIILSGSVKIKDNLPHIMNTIFGHVLIGPVTYAYSTPMESNINICQTFHSSTVADRLLERFWEIEDVPNQCTKNPKDLECENIFQRSHERNETGRYVVSLPFLSEKPSLGNSAQVARKRFLNMENRLQSNAIFRDKYVNFMREYVDLGHMSSIHVSVEDLEEGAHFIIPHHGIFKAGSDKLRVVFDASCLSSTGVSLNDCLHAGPKLQKDIAEVICKFRLHPVVFTTDIRMMFRCIEIQDADRLYQLIYWRESPDQPLQLYKLNTVTYGMKSSPYLAIRALRQLADDEAHRFPEAANLLKTSVYMDDILGGADSLDSAKKLKNELVDLLRSGGFELSKWVSNCGELLEDKPAEDLEKPRKFDNLDGSEFFKILGVQWNPTGDHFSYHFSLNRSDNCSKRSILSTLARTFDPLGWISPVIFQGKVLMQRLWLLNLSWDDKPPAEIVDEWNTIVTDLSAITDIKLNRFVLSGLKSCALHGFADASECGYGAAVYLRTVNEAGVVKLMLLMAKSRVAPVKSKLTIPKLELCGAILLTRIMSYVVAVIGNEIDITDFVCWSDSTIVLSWLRLPPHTLQVFEGNRVSQINDCGLMLTWRHVPSEMNPADVASRGCRAGELLNHPLWWGPPWLMQQEEFWPRNIIDKDEKDLPGLRNMCSNKLSKVFITSLYPDPLFEKFSSLSKLLSVVAYSFRFINNARNPSQRVVGFITVAERKSALRTLVKLVQIENFAVDLNSLKRNKECSARVRRLMPFVDSEGLLRVGGRLKNSDLSFDVKHPLLLPKDHPLTALIIDHFHKIHCHVGATALQAIIQKEFWILSARQAILSRIFKCIFCFRTQAKPVEPVMADLPTDRVNATGVFHTVQTDYAGPFEVKSSKLRNAKRIKAYLCVFICSATKAVHLEVVSDLTTEAFLAALARFVSRRGLPQTIRSDCGTNYVGSNNHLKDVYKYLNNSKIQETLGNDAAKQGIDWRFNAPAAPHFGGLFEAAVKSAKNLLRKVIGEQTLTYEELTTLFTRVEAVLNSRPLCPLSQDPHDVEVLTPAHFLIGRSLLAVPEYDYTAIPFTRLGRFQLVQAMSQRFWKRWSDQYLHTLQMRNKWTSTTVPPKVGDLVLIKEENVPPLKWKRGRILELLSGKDGFVRVVNLKTATGTMLRPVVKICRFPIE